MPKKLMLMSKNTITEYLSLYFHPLIFDTADDPCNPDPCKNAGTCEVLPLNSYYCACPAGWTGANCEQGE